MNMEMNIKSAMDTITEPWKPVEVGRFNGQIVRLIMCEGEFPEHQHPFDEYVYMYKGSLTLKTQRGTVELAEGEGCVMSKETNHQPFAAERSFILSTVQAS